MKRCSRLRPVHHVHVPHAAMPPPCPFFILGGVVVGSGRWWGWGVGVGQRGGVVARVGR